MYAFGFENCLNFEKGIFQALKSRVSGSSSVLDAIFVQLFASG